MTDPTKGDQIDSNIQRGISYPDGSNLVEQSNTTLFKHGLNPTLQSGLRCKDSMGPEQS